MKRGIVLITTEGGKISIPEDVIAKHGGPVAYYHYWKRNNPNRKHRFVQVGGMQVINLNAPKSKPLEFWTKIRGFFRRIRKFWTKF